MDTMRIYMLILVALTVPLSCIAARRTFEIERDLFIKDGEPFQLISGSIHYFRVPSEYWKDRLVRLKILGLNAVQVYVAWNKHEPTPGVFDFTGDLDLEQFLTIADEVGLLVVLRPGPYICAEWDFGGFPWWLASSQIAGGGIMKLRSEDPDFVNLVDRFWNVLLPKVARFLYTNGGPIIMSQVENEYGFCGSSKPYLRHLIKTARASLGEDAILFTTDPPWIVEQGSIKGDEVYTVVDFGPQVNASWAFEVQKTMNPPGKTAPFCSEYYTGWITHWAEPMANTSAANMTDSFTKILQYASGTGSVNLYVAHGGTNFGYFAGAGEDGTKFEPQITSYDYSAPLSEQGRTGQPGIGGPNKFKMLQEAITNHTGTEPPTWPEAIPTANYGQVEMEFQISVQNALPLLYPGDGIFSHQPLNMEEYGQGHGLILYQTRIPSDLLQNGGLLDLGAPVHDFAHVYMDGGLIQYLTRSHPRNVSLPAVPGNRHVLLEILVHAMGRNSGACDWDLKGLVAGTVTLDGRELRGWRVFPLPLDDPASVLFPESSKLRRAEGAASRPPHSNAPPGPAFNWGAFTVEKGTERGPTGHLPDTFLDVRYWHKGLAWVNGFNLGWYWPAAGPQNTLYLPGTLLREGENELVLLEVQEPADVSFVVLTSEPDFYGPSQDLAALAAHSMEQRRARSHPQAIAA